MNNVVGKTIDATIKHMQDTGCKTVENFREVVERNREDVLNNMDKTIEDFRGNSDKKRQALLAKFKK
jgi:hypothetical protein